MRVSVGGKTFFYARSLSPVYLLFSSALNSVVFSEVKNLKIPFKAYASEEILNWHSLNLNFSTDVCIHFYCLFRSLKVSFYLLNTLKYLRTF